MYCDVHLPLESLSGARGRERKGKGAQGVSSNQQHRSGLRRLRSPLPPWSARTNRRRARRRTAAPCCPTLRSSPWICAAGTLSYVSRYDKWEERRTAVQLGAAFEALRSSSPWRKTWCETWMLSGYESASPVLVPPRGELRREFRLTMTLFEYLEDSMRSVLFALGVCERRGTE